MLLNSGIGKSSGSQQLSRLTRPLSESTDTPAVVGSEDGSLLLQYLKEFQNVHFCIICVFRHYRLTVS
jgi:hypothetical protein